MSEARDLSAQPEAAREVSDARYVRRVVITLALIGVTWLTIELRELLLLAFGAILIALVFDTLARPIARITGCPKRWALLLAVVAVLALFGACAWLFGSRIAVQFAELEDALPRAWLEVREWLARSPWGERVAASASAWVPSGSGVMRYVGQVAKAALDAMAGLALVVAAGVYLAAHPRTYGSALLSLVPDRHQAAVRRLSDSVGAALRKWLGAQAISMSAVGLLTGLGLWAIGVPSALALALLAAVAEIVPVIGPIIAAVPALLIAATQGGDTLAWTAALYLAIQQIEGNVLTPMVTQRAVALPPALALFALAAFGILLGPLGVLFAAPLAVTLVVLVRETYLSTRT